MAKYTAPTDNYRRVRPDDTEYIGNLPSSIISRTSIRGYITHIVNTAGYVRGKPESHTAADSNGNRVAYHLLGRINGCLNINSKIALFKLINTGVTQSSFDSETVCSSTSVSFGSYAESRMTEIIFENDTGFVEHWKYDDSVSQGDELDDGIQEYPYIAPTDNYRLVRPSDAGFVPLKDRPTSINSTDLTITHHNVILGSVDSWAFRGLASDYTRGQYYGSNDFGWSHLIRNPSLDNWSLYLWRFLYGRLYDCSTNETNCLIKAQSEKSLPLLSRATLEEETSCGSTSNRYTTRIDNGVSQTLDFMVVNPDGHTEQWIYDDSVSAGDRLTGRLYDDGSGKTGMYYGEKSIVKIYRGTTEIVKVYRGTHQIWPLGSPQTPLKPALTSRLLTSDGNDLELSNDNDHLFVNHPDSGTPVGGNELLLSDNNFLELSDGTDLELSA